MDSLDHWISLKEHEILDDEGIIVNEEQLEQRILKYKVIDIKII